nr:hypothetical protein [Acidobacteriota bacterium]
KTGRVFKTSADTVRDVFTELCERVGSRRISPHDTRNCLAQYGTNYLGMPKPIIDVLLQHSFESRDVTGHSYYSLDNRGKKRAIQRWARWLREQAYPEVKDVDVSFTPDEIEYYMSQLSDEGKARFAEKTNADQVAKALLLAG